MGLHRPLAEVERPRHLRVGQAARDEPHHLELARGELPQAAGQRPVERRPAGVVLDELAGDRGSEQRVAAGHGAHGVDERRGRRVLEQEPGGAAPERLEHVLVEVEGGHDEHAGARHPRGDPPRRLEAVDPGHPHVHHDDVGTGADGLLDRLRPVSGLADDPDVLLILEDHAHAPADEREIVGQHDPDHAAQG